MYQATGGTADLAEARAASLPQSSITVEVMREFLYTGMLIRLEGTA